MAGNAVALRFIPYSESRGTSTPAGRCSWALLLVGVAASVYLIYVLEILKLRRFRTRQLRRDRSGHERARDRRAGRARFETGEFRRIA